MPPTMWRLAVLIGVILALALALALAGCGGGTSGGGGGPGGERASGCLSPSEVEAEVNSVAEGAEGSAEEVEKKQDAIAAIRANAC